MKDPIEEKINRWIQNGDDRFTEINLRINYLNDWLYYDYEPMLGGSYFLTRLASWLDNTKDEADQKTLLELVPHIFYIGREELNILYREAYHSIFARWLIDQASVDLSSNDALKTLNDEIVNTWFCPLTDSLRINQFYHINDIPGKHDHRPDWRSLRTFGNIELIRKYISENNIKRIVLLEDFIGNGGQVSKAVAYAVNSFPDIQILIIPLIICPAGLENAEKFSKEHANITVSPVLCVEQSHFVNEDESKIDSEFFKIVSRLAKQTYPQVSDSTVIDDNIDPYGPFGWRRTGGIIVMHTNTPNNSLPLIHNKSGTWEPLFKRHKRV